MSVLITGATGFVGRHLAKELLQGTSQVHSVGRTPLNVPGVTHHQVDLSDGAKTLATIESIRPSRVYHLAGISKVSSAISMPDYFRCNTQTTEFLMSALAKLGTPTDVFFGSSVHVYGSQLSEVDETSKPHPQSAYAFTKYLAEETLRNYGERFPNLRIAVARLYSCFGPGQPVGFVTSDFCEKIRQLPADGTGTLKVGTLDAFRRFLDVRDAVKLFPKILDQVSKDTERFQIFNIASPFELKIREILETLLAISKKKARIESSDMGTNPFLGLRLRIDKLQRLVPNAHFRPVEETLKDMWQQTAPG